MNEIEKAIEQLDKQIKRTINTVPIKSRQLAIGALEKQMPKKPIEYDKTNRANCPVCGVTVRGIGMPYGSYCSGCGQKLDWRVEE